jgi:hypothetical protein
MFPRMRKIFLRLRKMFPRMRKIIFPAAALAAR